VTKVKDIKNRAALLVSPFGPSARDFRRVAFVKAEIKDGYESDPRIIQDTTPMAHYLQGPLCYAMSKLLMGLWTGTFILYANGLTGAEVGALLRDFERYYVGDISRYDRSIAELICRVFSAWRRLFCISRDELRAFIAQEKTKGSSLHGRTQYEVPGQRKSGDDNTSLDNSLLNAFLHCFVFIVLGYSWKWLRANTQIFVLGDDIVIGYPASAQWVVDLIPSLLRELGFVVKPKTVDDKDLVQFCSKFFWRVGGTRVLAAKPGRQLQKIGWGVNPNDIDFEAKLYGTLYENRCVPFLAEYCQAGMPNLKRAEAKWHLAAEKDQGIKRRRITGSPPWDTGTLDQFVKIYGFGAIELAGWMAMLATWNGKQAAITSDVVERMLARE
jgi:hypothetical protein